LELYKKNVPYISFYFDFVPVDQIILQTWELCFYLKRWKNTAVEMNMINSTDKKYNIHNQRNKLNMLQMTYMNLKWINGGKRQITEKNGHLL
jgi:hypothetical protein